MSKYFPNMPIGARGGLLDWKHVVKMDRSVFLFLWAVLRQTGRGKDGRGVVNYGKALTTRQIAEEMRAPYTTIRKWLARQEQHGYLERRFFPDQSFALFVCSEKKFCVEKLLASAFQHAAVRPHTVGGSDHTRSEGPTTNGQRHPSKPMKTFGFTTPNVKDIEKEWTKNRRPAAAVDLSLNYEEQKTEQQKPKTFREVTQEKQLPTAATQRQAEAAMRAQLATYRDYCKRHGIAI